MALAGIGTNGASELSVAFNWSTKSKSGTNAIFRLRLFYDWPNNPTYAKAVGRWCSRLSQL
jgi:hypothetical protein